jgi:hypothetical protein
MLISTGGQFVFACRDRIVLKYEYKINSIKWDQWVIPLNLNVLILYWVHVEFVVHIKNCL